MYPSLRFMVVSLFVAILCATGASAQKPHPQTHTAASGSPPAVLQAASLERMPTKAPTIIYANGQLAISADNCTLDDILKGISAETGAEIDIPPQAQERVVTHLGPGPAHDVVQSLLTGSRFNFIIVGSNEDPNGLSKILLFPIVAAENASQPLGNTNGTVQRTTLERPKAEDLYEAVQPVENAGQPTPPARSFQQMLQQRGQARLEEFQRKQQAN